MQIWLDQLRLGEREMREKRIGEWAWAFLGQKKNKKKKKRKMRETERVVGLGLVL